MNRSFQNFQRALLRLEEALNLQPNALIIDGTLQRFEFTFETAWKALRRLLFVHKGAEISFPRDALQSAYVAGWIHDEKLWLNMLKHRNETSHIYDEAKAEEIYGQIPAYAKALRVLCDELQQRFPTSPTS